MTTANAIRRAIEALPEGKAFPVKDLLQLGTRAAVDQVLYRMAKENEILRVARGIYARPKWNKYVKAPVMPEPHEVAELVARTRGATIGPTGAEAVHRLGLSTQMPTQPVYDTTGRTGEVKVGKNTIRFRHVAPRKMQYAGTVVGTAIAALRYLGKKQVTPQVIATLEQALTKEDFLTLRQATTALPGWAMDKFYDYEAQRGHRIP
jgi:transposase InsO family protein